MKTAYAIILLIHLALSGILFMLVKTWVMINIHRIMRLDEVVRRKDRYWNYEGWVAVLVFLSWLITFHVLLILDFKF